MSFIVYLD